MKKSATALVWIALALSIGLAGCIGNHMPTYPDSDDEQYGPGDRDPTSMIAPDAFDLTPPTGIMIA